MSEQLLPPPDPNQEQLFTEQVVGVRPGEGDVTRLVDYNNKFMGTLDTSAPTEEVRVYNPDLDRTNPYKYKGIKMVTIPEGEKNPFITERRPAKRLMPANTEDRAIITTTTEKRSNGRSRISKGLRHLAQFFDKSAEASDSGVEKAKKFSRKLGSIAIGSRVAIDRVNQKIDTKYEAWRNLGNNTGQRLGNLSLVATLGVRERIEAKQQATTEKVEDKVVDIIDKRKKRRSTSDPESRAA